MRPARTWQTDLSCVSAKHINVRLPSAFACRGFICRRDVSVAVGVQAVMDLVLKVSIVTAGSAGRALRLGSAHGCVSAARHLRLRSGAVTAWSLAGWSWSRALELASTVPALINLFNLTILYR